MKAPHPWVFVRCDCNRPKYSSALWKCWLHSEPYAFLPFDLYVPHSYYTSDLSFAPQCSKVRRGLIMFHSEGQQLERVI